MTNKVTTLNGIIEDIKLREELILRVEVLDKVKGLLLLPNTEYATVQQVADFYEVDNEAIQSIATRFSEELISDGYAMFKKNEVLKLLNVQVAQLELMQGKTIVKYDNVDELQVANRGLRLFPRRAILRIGMLLRDSKIAVEIRNQLLNIEAKVSSEVKVADIEEEDSLILAVNKATNEAERMLAVSKLRDFDNRYIKELETIIQVLQPKAENWDDYISSEDTISFTTFGNQYLNGISAQQIRKLLQDRGVLSKKRVDNIFQPIGEYNRYFKLVPYPITDSDGNTKQSNSVKIRMDGLEVVRKIILS